ncbi:MAG: hypothetical protein JST54_15655 [Deltaproteobacteria bacterium]|nr:hypothetical protein [Deltaproteobacteria bacterium]
MRITVVAALAALSLGRAAFAEAGPTDEQAAQPPEAEPEGLPPPPEAQPTPPPDAPTAVAAPAEAGPAAPATGQWVYTGQYGWVWMPYGQQYTYVPADTQLYPYSYVYYPVYGWRWVVAPWVYGWGPAPYWGAWGPRYYVWYSRPWFHRGGYYGWGGYHGWGEYRGWVGPRSWGREGWSGAPAYYHAAVPVAGAPGVHGAAAVEPSNVAPQAPHSNMPVGKPEPPHPVPVRTLTPSEPIYRHDPVPPQELAPKRGGQVAHGQPVRQATHVFKPHPAAPHVKTRRH